MTDSCRKQVITEVKGLVAEGQYQRAWAKLKGGVRVGDDFALQMRYAKLLGQMPTEALELQKVRIGIVASSTVDHFVELLRFWLARAGLAAEIYQGPFDTVHQTILNGASDLYAFEPDVVMILTNYRDVRCEVAAGSSSEEIERAVSQAVQEFATLGRELQDRCGCHVLQNNADLPAGRVFGNYEGTAPWGNANVLRRFNLELAQAMRPGMTIFDVDFLSSVHGKSKWHDERFWYHSRHACALEATGMVAHQAAMVIAGIRGLAKKCLVLDLDNTLWGGVIADDRIEGIALGAGTNGEAFVEFQEYLLGLKERGVVLTVCSKNDRDKAVEPFLKHPDMVIKLDDIAVFRANWDNKADNIRAIAAQLHLGLQSMVFVDDNPSERELVRQLLPMVGVPEMHDDPSGYRGILSAESFFETASYSTEDADRAERYGDNAKRDRGRAQCSDISEFLRSLEMVATVGGIDEFSLPRAVQLINKSNQFHLTTTRYGEGHIRAMLNDPSRHCRCFWLEDRFGKHGLISVVILAAEPSDRLLVDTWVMSCRVLSKGMEDFVCGEIVGLARQLGCRSVRGKYIPTQRNQLVAGLYERLGFGMCGQQSEATLWELDLEGELPEYDTFIARKAQMELV